MLTLVTTCKNRLPHLQQTLPAMLRQSYSDVIVVDYGCEQGTAEWVSKNHPDARVIKVDDDPNFCAARARNIGARHALSDYLLFIDADTILKIDVGLWLKENVQPNWYYISGDRQFHYDLWGFVICDRNAFNLIEGYDEAFREWGGEDKDLYLRLKLLGRKEGAIPGRSLTPIAHADDMRQLTNNPLVNFAKRQQHIAFNKWYRLIKLDAQRLMQQSLDLETRMSIRRTLFSAQTKATSEGGSKIRMTISLPTGHDQVEREMVYKIRL